MIFKNLTNKYILQVKRTPFRLAMITGSSIAFTGDIMCQFIEYKKYGKPYDIKRSMNYGLCRFFMAPQIFIWYRKLNILKYGINKMIIDQIIFSPYHIFFVLSYMSFINNGNYKEWKKI